LIDAACFLQSGPQEQLWVGKESTIESFQKFFTTIGEEIASKIVFICSDIWEPYLKLIREECSEVLHILDRFHIVAKMNKPHWSGFQSELVTLDPLKMTPMRF
jgi:transposase